MSTLDRLNDALTCRSLNVLQSQDRQVTDAWQGLMVLHQQSTSKFHFYCPLY